MSYGVSSMTDRLRRVVVRQPGPSMLNADPQKWHYGTSFNPRDVTKNHAAFVSLLEESGAEVLQMGNDDGGIADAVFTYDASLMTGGGAILLRPGKPLRQGEEEAHRSFYEAHDIPVVGAIEGDATAEGGDTFWLDDKTLAVGRGYRTNDEGIRQLTEMMREQSVETKVFDLPHYQGAEACLHLMSLVSLVDTRTALVCLPMLPVGLLQLMTGMGYRLIETPMDEFEQTATLNTNVLATAPGQCIMLDGIPKTRAALERDGVTVRVFDGNSLCIGCEGGPTCLTRPIWRTP